MMVKLIIVVACCLPCPAAYRIRDLSNAKGENGNSTDSGSNRLADAAHWSLVATISAVTALLVMLFVGVAAFLDHKSKLGTGGQENQVASATIQNRSNHHANPGDSSTPNIPEEGTVSTENRVTVHYSMTTSSDQSQSGHPGVPIQTASPSCPGQTVVAGEIRIDTTDRNEIRTYVPPPCASHPSTIRAVQYIVAQLPLDSTNPLLQVPPESDVLSDSSSEESFDMDPVVQMGNPWVQVPPDSDILSQSSSEESVDINPAVQSGNPSIHLPPESDALAQLNTEYIVPNPVRRNRNLFLQANPEFDVMGENSIVV